MRHTQQECTTRHETNFCDHSVDVLQCPALAGACHPQEIAISEVWTLVSREVNLGKLRQIFGDLSCVCGCRVCEITGRLTVSLRS